ncbi:MAG: hypothetical protein LBL67_04650 [Coriobacteriales bacterium]|nr:hypothetical protein [Coriobacteriales bacterium]
MCFRPAQVQADIKCPKCASSNPVGSTHCSACGAELPQDAVNPHAGEAMAGAFGASGHSGGGFAPRQPGAPQSPPGAPAAPGAPKPPSA